MAGPDDVGSDRAELKRLLKLAGDQPINMAFALNADGKAVVQLHKMKQPRALEKALKEGLDGAKNHRFGTVVLDPDNPKLVKFMVNKAVGGFARKLTIALKGTGYSKVQIVTEDGEVEEAESEEPDETDAADTARPHVTADDGEEAVSRRVPEQGDVPVSPSMTPPPTIAPAATPAITPSEMPVAAAADVPKVDAAGLTKDLTGLVKQMLDAIRQDPSQKTALAELATDAKASLKRGDLDQAAAAIEILRLAVAAGGAGTPAANAAPVANGAAAPDPAAPNAPAAGATNGKSASPADAAQVQTFRKSRVAWTATRAKIDGELQKLSKAILDASDGEDMGDSLENDFYAAVDPVLSTLDETLSDILSQAADATDAEERRDLMDQARRTLDDYMGFVQGNAIIADLDNNPFVPLAIEKTLTTTLTTLSAMMR